MFINILNMVGDQIQTSSTLMKPKVCSSIDTQDLRGIFDAETTLEAQDYFDEYLVDHEIIGTSACHAPDIHQAV